MSESTQTKLLSSVSAISSLAEGDKITVVTASGQTALVSLSDLLATVKVGGRNMLKGSNVDITSDKNISIGRYNLAGAKPEFGEWYTLSMCYTLNGESIRASLTGGSLYETFEFSKNGTRVVASKSMLFGANTPSGTTIFPTVEFYRQKAGDTYPATIHWAVLTKGKNLGVSDWTPAPEDLSWGGINYSFSEASKASARISQKGGPHEYIDNYADKGSHQCNPEGNTLGCTRQQRLRHRLRSGNVTRSLLHQPNDSERAHSIFHVRHLCSSKKQRPHTANRCVMARWDTTSVSLILLNCSAELETRLSNGSNLVVLGKEVAA